MTHLDQIPIIMCFLLSYYYGDLRDLHSFPTRRSSDLTSSVGWSITTSGGARRSSSPVCPAWCSPRWRCGCTIRRARSEEHTSELQSHSDIVCRLLLEKKKTLTSRKASVS